jgi:flavin-binding protein dodecin
VNNISFIGSFASYSPWQAASYSTIVLYSFIWFWQLVIKILEVDMSKEKIYKKIEMVGSSKISIEDAISNAIEQCQNTIKNMDWFEVVDTRGHIVDGKVGHFQVTIKIGFKIEHR